MTSSRQLGHGQAVGLMVLVTLLWGTAGVVTRSLDSACSFELTFWRSAFTAAAPLVLLGVYETPLPSTLQGGALVLAALLGNANG